jgi:heat shock protein HslJ
MTSRPAADAAVSLLLVVVLAACATAPIPSASAAPPLGDTAWTVMSVGGSGTLVDARPTMAFGADGQVTGTSGCNSYGGPYTLDGDAIQIGELASTLILCEGDRGSQEMAFMAALRGVHTWRITEPRELHLAGLSEIVAQPAIDGPSGSPADEGLVGRWDLAEMGPTADLAHLLPTIEFTADGQVSGSAACNTFSGTYTTDGSALTFGGLATTKIGCQRPASAVEAEYLQALSGVTTWTVEPDGRLLLDGPVPLRYTRH